ncbi:hypothetical protein PPL_08356 [Heterostelium album PN500]|uniref:Uncharacterized protein n=1 Tax=Heterostelium pallidum (strain ATCC 26659 / Pp 5 / PN500) TaxID=670386 RepID=D3BHY8_HETP5|nr:hypothetical protein PPL_08356 [Heterostelium album PN500]EFA78888.1 hypothetical protein PPL_08356 [Heterostelium album PN500]|eukprot:XP_020431012.1 hypothetical protein PPL_08356 [Heterostelium album PN500]
MEFEYLYFTVIITTYKIELIIFGHRLKDYHINTHLGDRVSEISNHFEKLHQFLIVEEHRLKKPLTIDQDIVKDNSNNVIDR